MNQHKKKTVIIANQGDEDPTVCLLAKYQTSEEPVNTGNWLIDSGCSNHMTYDKYLFSSYLPGHHSPVELGDSKMAKVLGKVTINLTLSVNGNSANCILHNVLYGPDLGYQLLSVTTTGKSGLTTSFHSRRFWITAGRTLLAAGTVKRNLYRLDTSPTHVHTAFFADASLWHLPIAQVHPSTMAIMSKLTVGTGLSVT